MQTYIYTSSTGRNHLSGGRTRTFTVYRMKRNQPDYMGNFKVNTASYAGDNYSVRAWIAKQTRSRQLIALHGIGAL